MARYSAAVFMVGDASQRTNVALSVWRARNTQKLSTGLRLELRQAAVTNIGRARLRAGCTEKPQAKSV